MIAFINLFFIAAVYFYLQSAASSAFAIGGGKIYGKRKGLIKSQNLNDGHVVANHVCYGFCLLSFFYSHIQK